MKAGCARVVATLFLGGLALAQEPGAEPFQAVVSSFLEAPILLLQDGRKMCLQGISLPGRAVRPEGFRARLARFLEERVGKERKIWIYPGASEDPSGRAELVGLLRHEPKSSSVNEEVLERGLALFGCRTEGGLELERLLAAAKRAQAKPAGWFAKVAGRREQKLGFLNGAVLGLHHQGEKWDYHRQLDELSELGFKHICLLFSVFVEKVDSVQIDLRHKRTVRDGRLIETIEYARKKGLSVMLLPILLILKPDDDDWRGVLRPKDEAKFWQNYASFLAHYLDIAEHGGVDIFCIGSELGSLEDRTKTWLGLIRNARGRFRGWLAYSANWDHVHVARFFDSLDLIGMSAYFSLTKKTDPSLDELVAQWHRVKKELKKSLGKYGRKVVFTELGYASQDGINRNPWDYIMNKEKIDLGEQAQCFEAFMKVVPEMDFLRGAYFFDYFDVGGPKDWSYSPRGKPAMLHWKAWAKR